jgi:hypothetical protein
LGLGALGMTPDEQVQMRVRAAERAHDNETVFGNAANQAAIKNGEEAIKAALLVNGGSCVAVLTFLGTLASRDHLSAAQIGAMVSPLFWFAAGLVAAMMCAAMAYFTNLTIAGTSSAKQREYETPFVRDTPASQRYRTRGEWFRWAAFICMAASLGCFVAGLYFSANAFRGLDASAKPAATAPAK